MDEILVKGQDGKWYILKGEEMVPYDEGTQGLGTQVRGSDLPKGVSEKVYERLEAKPQIRPSQIPQISSVQSAPKSVVPISHTEHPLFKELEELVGRVVENIKAELLPRAQPEAQLFGGDQILQKRFRMIVSARLRDVRDASETRQMLLRGPKVGGMGFGSESGIMNQESGVELISEIIERAFGDFQAKWKALEDQRRQAWRAKQAQEVRQREEESTKQEEKGLEERYARLTGGIAKEIPKPNIQNPKLISPAQSVTPVMASAAKQSYEIATSPRLRGTPRNDSNAGLAMTKTKVSLPSPALKLPTPTPSTTSYALRPTSSSKVTDVRPAPKLLGPVEEIGSLRLEDFRRLPGSSAQERISSISVKIDLLGRESLRRRGQGLEAWRNSPLNQLYNQIVQAALQNRASPSVIVEEWSRAGKTALTADEFHAIMELNQKLRF